MRHLTCLFDVNASEAREILDLARGIKQRWQQGDRPPLCAGLTLTQVFEKPSLRTRVSFAAAIQQLGGSSIFLTGKEAGLEWRESTLDVIRVLGGYSDFIVLRTFSQRLIDEFAQHSGTCVINGLSDESHPCQALADLMTIEEAFGRLSGLKLAYIGDGNNVARSLALACAQFGIEMSLATPPGYEIADAYLKEVVQSYPQAAIMQGNDPQAAVRGAHVIYTDVWASMGQEQEKEQRNKVFAPFQITTQLLDAADPQVRFMHCLPARRGLEVTDEVMNDSRCIVFPQAENRMHMSKGLFVWLHRHR